MLLSGSFRDPSGFIFLMNGMLYRQINRDYAKDYTHFIKSGFYNELIKNKLLIPHEEVKIPPYNPDTCFKVIRPDRVPFISYPYEWCFTQLKQAALTTLQIQKISLDFGMTLKDASAYNIQFINGSPIFIDTLSFEIYEKGTPWIAYRQFCQHFLSPLLLMHYTDMRLNQLFRIYIDGVPLDLTSLLLPKKTWFQFSIFMHIHMHAKSEKKYAGLQKPIQTREIRKNALLGLIDSLTTTINKLNWQPEPTEWRDYYLDTNYSLEAFEHKKEIVSEFLEYLHPTSVWDIGANTGLFSRIASEKGIYTIAFDIDPACVELNYWTAFHNHERNLLPLLLDLSNPSPGIGWRNKERLSFIERGPVDTILALALIHHLAISNNIPFSSIANFFSEICTSLIIEFVPKEDSQVQRLLLNRKDIFPDYRSESFEEAFIKYFDIKKIERIKNSQRKVYIMVKRNQ